MKPDTGGDETATGHPAGSLSELFHSWRYFFRLLGLALLVLLFYSEENWRGRWAWERYKHEMEARGVRFAAAAFVPPDVPDSENFAQTPLLAPLFQLNNWSYQPIRLTAFERARELVASATRSSGGARSNSWVKPQTDLAAWYGAFLAPTNGPARRATDILATNWTREVSAAGVLAALSETEGALEELRGASHLPYSRFKIPYDNDNPAAIPLPHLGALKRIDQIVQLRASAELALGRTGEAFEDVQLMLRITDACRDEPLLISQMVRAGLLPLALQVISEGLGQWSEPQLRVFQERLGCLDFCARAQRALEAECTLFGVGIIDYLRRAPDKSASNSGGSQQGGSGLEGALFSAAPSGWLYFEQVNYSKTYREYVLPTVESDPPRVSRAASRRADERVASLKRSSWLVLLARHRALSPLLMTDAARPVQRIAFAQTGADLAGLACALERYRRAHGNFPDTLESLTPRFLEAVPRDVVNGEPLKYRLEQGGRYVLYSVGWNEKDDGGRAGFPQDRGDGGDEAEGDWVWRPVGRE